MRFATLRRLRDAYASGAAGTESSPRLDRLVDGDLLWDEVVEVRDTGVTETIFDIEVRPGGRHIENFLAGSGGVFVSNTAGFVDAGWDGHLTLELSNVANLPIALYPGMKIGQISFLRMTTAAEHPYGSQSHRFQVPGAARAHAVALLPELPPRRGVAVAVPEPVAVRMGGHRAAHGRLPRRRLGRAHPRRRALFELLTLEGAQAG